MTQPQKPTTDFNFRLDGPICPKCGVHTALTKVEPDLPGIDRRTFECHLCGFEESILVNFREEGILIKLK